MAEREDGEEGEIWINSPSVAVGYWGQPELTEATFRAQIQGGEGGDTPPQYYLRTGDLGVVSRECDATQGPAAGRAQLLVSGRIKDLMIVRGRNYYPQDIEGSVEQACAAQVRPGCTAAFTVEQHDYDAAKGGPGGSGAGDMTDVGVVVVVAAEFTSTGGSSVAQEEEAVEAVQAIRRRIARDHGLAVNQVLLLTPRSIPKTTSGKIRRYECRERFLQQELVLVPAQKGSGRQ
jgi:fatty acid CoA ligase FadD32